MLYIHQKILFMDLALMMCILYMDKCGKLKVAELTSGLV